MSELKVVETIPAGPLLRENPAPGILRLVLANPPANTLSEAMLDALSEALDDAASDKTVRVVIIAASGKIFSAGHDLKEITARRSDADRGHVYFKELMTRCSSVMQKIVNLPKPVIAEVNGLATAAGCQLVASSDLVIASEDATFCTPGVHIGLFCSTPMVALSRAVAPKHAMEMLLTGEAITPSHAREIGLVNRVVPVEYLQPVTLQYASKIAEKSAHTLKVGKQAFYQQSEMKLAEAYLHCSEVMTLNMLDADAEEGIGAFLESRKPSWRDPD